MVKPGIALPRDNPRSLRLPAQNTGRCRRAPDAARSSLFWGAGGPARGAGWRLRWKRPRAAGGGWWGGAEAQKEHRLRRAASGRSLGDPGPPRSSSPPRIPGALKGGAGPPRALSRPLGGKEPGGPQPPPHPLPLRGLAAGVGAARRIGTASVSYKVPL